MVVKSEYNVQINKYISKRSDTCTENLLNKAARPSVVFQTICYFDHALKVEGN